MTGAALDAANVCKLVLFCFHEKKYNSALSNTAELSLSLGPVLEKTKLVSCSLHASSSNTRTYLRVSNLCLSLTTNKLERTLGNHHVGR